MSTNDLKTQNATILNKNGREVSDKAVKFDNDTHGSELTEALANGDMDHLEELEKANDLLREDWFDHQSFSPS